MVSLAFVNFPPYVAFLSVNILGHVKRQHRHQRAPHDHATASLHFIFFPQRRRDERSVDSPLQVLFDDEVTGSRSDPK